jgi:cytochrome c-type biogenesis protein CcmH/NrfG
VSLGRLYRHLGRFDEALEAVSDALEVDPGLREALLLGAEASSDRGNTPAMVRFANLMLARDSSDGEAAALLAEARLRAGELDRASREASSILTVYPEETRALQVHAIAHAELGNRNLARESLKLQPSARTGSAQQSQEARIGAGISARGELSTVPST